MYIFLLGGWVARPSAFYFVAFLCSPCLILSGLRGRSVFCCCLACTLSQCSDWSHFAARVPVLNLSVLGRLVFPSMPSFYASLG